MARPLSPRDRQDPRPTRGPTIPSRDRQDPRPTRDPTLSPRDRKDPRLAYIMLAACDRAL
ncbi:MAG: hypothetical protein ACOYM4_14560 [Nodosilinea sp.]